jgi:hypothetical protein
MVLTAADPADWFLYRSRVFFELIFAFFLNFEKRMGLPILHLV